MKLFWMFLLSSFGVFAQNDAWIKVSYRGEHNFGLPTYQNDVFFFRGAEAFYKEGARVLNIKENSKFKIEERVVSDIKEFGNFFAINLKNNEFKVYDEVDKKKYVASETLFAINWKIDKKSTKKIMNYECFKAEGSFRGRDYTVWFTEEIAVPLGPWKLNGLPGLILEVSDKLGQVKFFAQTIQKVTESKFLNIFLEAVKSDYQEVSYQEYLYFLEEERVRMIRADIARISREQKVTSYTINTERTEYELKYEWEKF